MAWGNFLVRCHLQQVEEFSERSRWDNLGETDVDAIAQSLAQLPNGLPQENHLAKRFDLLLTAVDLVQVLFAIAPLKRNIPLTDADLILGRITVQSRSSRKPREI